MPLFNSQRPRNSGSRWLGTATTVAVELLILIALAFTVVRYVEWSSEAAQAEFMAATKPSASDPNQSGTSSTPIQALRGRAACDRKG
jgi:hypothetical protein